MELKEFVNVIEKHLLEKNAVIGVAQLGKKLTKPNTNHNKFNWSLSDIVKYYGSVNNMLIELPKSGFTNGAVLSLRKLQGKSRVTTLLINEVELKFNNPVPTEAISETNTKNPQKNQTMEDYNSRPAQVETPKQETQQPQLAMGFTQVPQYEWINLNVQKERFSDLLERLAKAEKDRDKAESDYRMEKERAFALERKLETIEDKYELKIERELNNKKSFFDSETGKEVIGALSANLGTILQTFKGGQPQIAMGAPGQELSPTKQEFLQKLTHIPEEFMPYLHKVAHYSFTSDEFYEHVNAAIMQLDQQNNENRKDNG